MVLFWICMFLLQFTTDWWRYNINHWYNILGISSFRCGRKQEDNYQCTHTYIFFVFDNNVCRFYMDLSPYNVHQYICLKQYTHSICFVFNCSNSVNVNTEANNSIVTNKFTKCFNFIVMVWYHDTLVMAFLYFFLNKQIICT